MIRILISILSLILLTVSPALSRQDDPRLDQLFGQLQVTEDAQKAAALQTAIWTIWTESGSDSMDLLLKQGVAAMHAGNHPAALKIFSTVVKIDPGFAEGWNKRATLYYLMGDYPRSILDIEQTLDLEPRHFGALTGLGSIYEALDDKPRALDAYRRALAVNPRLRGAARSVKTLEKEVEGRGI